MRRQSTDLYPESHLPDSMSPNICLRHPTVGECAAIWASTSIAWKDSLTVQEYLQESLFLTNVPLAKEGGMTNWILVDKNLPPDQRSILCSCESFRKRALVSDKLGNVSDSIVHGIASVFCPPYYRGRGYAPRMMRELAVALQSWQSEQNRCVGSILYSDIGKSYYASFGWHPTPTNTHVVFQPKILVDGSARLISVEDLPQLCKEDEMMIRKAMAKPADEEILQKHMTILPDLDHMLWHNAKEEFACKILFERVPTAKGAIAGPPGSRVWAIWTHRYYTHPSAETDDNTLYILRLVIENQGLGETCYSDRQDGQKYHPQVGYLRAVLVAAQTEAAEWNLSQVRLWHSTTAVQYMINQTGIEHSIIEREAYSIASCLWYDEDHAMPEWINNEHYSWC